MSYASRVHAWVAAVIVATTLLLIGDAQARFLPGAYWLDPTKEASLAEAQAASDAGAFTPFAQRLLHGYTESAAWLRFEIPPSAPGAEARILRFRPPWHDHIELHDPEVAPNTVRRTGDTFPISADAYPSLNLNFSLQASEESRYIWVRITSPHNMLAEVQLLELEEAWAVDQRQLIIMTALMAFLALVFLGTLLTWPRERVLFFAILSLKIFIGIAYMASMFGFLRLLLDDWISNATLNHLNHLLIVLYPTATAAMYATFFASYRVPPFARRGTIAILIAAAGCIPIMLFGQVQLALQLSSVVIAAAGAWYLLMIWVWMKQEENPSPLTLPLWLLRVTFTLPFALAALIVGPALGIWPNFSLPLEGYLVNVLVISMVFAGSEQYRAQLERHAKLRAEQRAADEAAAREGLQRFVDMLSHEVRTPLSILSLAVEQGLAGTRLGQQARGAITDLDLLVTKTLQVDRIEADSIEATLQPMALALIVQECLSRFALSERINLLVASDAFAQGDPYLTEIVVLNLLDNAYKYAPAGTPIDIAITEREPQAISLVVGNQVDGRGLFDPERVFDRYYRSPQASRRSGAGLGLYLSKGLAEMQRGSLLLSHFSQERVEFELRLPK